MSSEEDARHVAEAWIAAWNRHDLDAILDLYASGIVSVSPLELDSVKADLTIVGGEVAFRRSG